MDYTILQLSLKDLEKYQHIPMLKCFSSLISFDDKGNIKEIPAKTQTIDLAKEESMEEWRALLPEETTKIFVISKQDSWIAGAIVVTHAKHIHMFQGDMRNAVLWDIRVDPAYQGLGLGNILFQEVYSYAKTQNCHALLIETQNNNPNAIKFYLRNGATLFKTNMRAYDDYPEEIQYIFQKFIT